MNQYQYEEKHVFDQDFISESAEVKKTKKDTKSYTIEQAVNYVEDNKTIAKMHSIAIGLYINCISPLILLFAMSETFNFNEDTAMVFGLLFMPVMIAAGVILNVEASRRKRTVQTRRRINPDEDTKLYMEDTLAEVESRRSKNLVYGILLLVFCWLPYIPLALADPFTTLFIGIAFLAMTIMIAAGTGMIVSSEMMRNAVRRLFVRSNISEEENPVVQEEKEKERMYPQSSLYWGLMTAGYLLYSFSSGNWGSSWILWPIAAVIYPIWMKFLRERNEENERDSDD